MKCYCKSNKEYSNCCEEVIQNGASSALDLMKSRYSAYCNSNMEYIKATSSQKQLNDLDIEFLRNWSKNSHWQHLEIVSNNESDDKGFVEFKAYYIYDNIQRCHHEKSYFIKIDSKWYYDAGELVEDNFKIGRNDPCICQSNNKYKKCCGKLIK